MRLDLAALTGLSFFAKDTVVTLGPDPTSTMTMTLGLVDAVGNAPDAEAAYDSFTLPLR